MAKPRIGRMPYPYFQDMIIDGKPILETLDKYYRQNKICDFMEEAYTYCLKHENEIRKHIKAAENAY